MALHVLIHHIGYEPCSARPSRRSCRPLPPALSVQAQLAARRGSEPPGVTGQGAPALSQAQGTQWDLSGPTLIQPEVPRKAPSGAGADGQAPDPYPARHLS